MCNIYCFSKILVARTRVNNTLYVICLGCLVFSLKFHFVSKDYIQEIANIFFRFVFLWKTRWWDRIRKNVRLLGKSGEMTILRVSKGVILLRKSEEKTIVRLCKVVRLLGKRGEMGIVTEWKDDRLRGKVAKWLYWDHIMMSGSRGKVWLYWG